MKPVSVQFQTLRGIIIVLFKAWHDGSEATHDTWSHTFPCHQLTALIVTLQRIYIIYTLSTQYLQYLQYLDIYLAPLGPSWWGGGSWSGWRRARPGPSWSASRPLLCSSDLSWPRRGSGQPHWEARGRAGNNIKISFLFLSRENISSLVKNIWLSYLNVILLVQT